MFCDVVGSTRLSALLDPEDLADVIRACREAVTAVVRQFDGFIAQFLASPLRFMRDASQA
jgi:class 3 adenylate cyclase